MTVVAQGKVWSRLGGCRRGAEHDAQLARSPKTPHDGVDGISRRGAAWQPSYGLRQGETAAAHRRECRR